MRKIFAAIFLALLANRGEAALHYADFHDQMIPSDSSGIYVNPVTGIVTHAPPADMETAPWINLFFGGTAIGTNSTLTIVISAPASGNGDGLALKLPDGSEIGPDLNYTVGPNGSENHTGSAPGQFQSGEPGYIGFATEPAGGGPVSYGWLCITVNEAGAGMVHDSAWEDTPGLAIQAGAVPEPGAVAMLLMTAAALSCARRR